MKVDVEALRHREGPYSGHCAKHSTSGLHLVSQRPWEADVTTPIYM